MSICVKANYPSYLVPRGLLGTLTKLSSLGADAGNTCYFVLCVPATLTACKSNLNVSRGGRSSLSLPLHPPSRVQFIAKLTGFDVRSSCPMNLLRLTATVFLRVSSASSVAVAYKEYTHSNAGQSQSDGRPCAPGAMHVVTIF